MSDSEEENYCFYGKALEQYDEDAFPKKRPISVEEQIATDEQGRRRFHGAFTGGFSAGFYNTVGSLEGWRPTEFISSRSEKAEKKVSKPEDYMDSEDISEFGIAPQTVKATKDYATTKKRKKQVFSDGPIPGEPVLHTLITSGNETVGYLLMKNMSLKTRPVIQDADSGGQKTYGCIMPKTYEVQRNNEDEYFIPEVYKNCLANPKINTFGLGYSGLDKSHVNLFKSSQLVMHDKNNKKLSISGQAFGVGAFENEDDDIYVTDDMTKYDFELTSEAKSKKAQQTCKANSVFNDFVLAKTPLLQPEKFPPPVIPHSFSGKHNVKKSRFEPIVEEPVARKDINAAVRARYLGEEAPVDNLNVIPSSSKVNETPPAVDVEVSVADVIKVESNIETENINFASGLIFGKFVSATQKENLHDILESVERSRTDHGTQEMRDAAKLNMFGPLTRVTLDWKPCSLLCKRFNVPEPTLDAPKRDTTRRKTAIIFEYQKHSMTDVALEPGLVTPKDNSNKAVTSEAIVPEKEKENDNATENANEIQMKPPPPVEKMEEEISIVRDITDKIDVSKNMDLFKAVFLSSSESESEDDDKKQEVEEQSRNELIKSTVLSDHFIPKIKTNKEGILSNIGHKFNPLFRNPDKDVAKSVADDMDMNRVDDNSTNIEKDKVEDPTLYGPKLPAKIQPVEKTVLPQIVISEEKWVEKDVLDKKKSHKHKKKHKKEKHHKKERKVKYKD